jgi:hypothetical protein
MSIAKAHGLGDDKELSYKAVEIFLTARRRASDSGLAPPTTKDFLDFLRTIIGLGAKVDRGAWSEIARSVLVRSENDTPMPALQEIQQPSTSDTADLPLELHQFDWLTPITNEVQVPQAYVGDQNIAPSPNPGRSILVFLCHSSGDKPVVRRLYERLHNDHLLPWLDEKNIIPGMDWDQEIKKAVRRADLVVVCLSQRSVAKSGYVQREIRIALDAAEEKPEGQIYIVPARLEPCDVPERLRRYQWVNLYEEHGYSSLLKTASSIATARNMGPDESANLT